MRLQVLIFLNILLFTSLYSQNIKISGTVTNDLKEPLPGCIIRVLETNTVTTSDPNGYYELKASANSDISIVVSFMNNIDTLKLKITNKSQNLNIILNTTDLQLSPIYAYAFDKSETSIERINAKSISALPSISGNAVEQLLKTTMGVSSSNEMTSQYNVRGGNFDENLVYINDIEVYRPFLVRSGQQEGMSIINSDMVENIKFSAGGFEAQYADKMSSVLDISYKKPEKFNVITNIGIINQRLYVENLSKNKKFGTLLGVRYKRSDYLLKTLEVKGAYKPIFADIQLYNTLDLSSKINLGLLIIGSSNIYRFFPENSVSEMGTFTNPIKINIYYDGSEQDTYNQFFTALSFNYRISNYISLKFNLGNYISDEAEKFDIIAAYSLYDIVNQQDTTTKDSLQNWGYGLYINHARNKLFVNTKTLNAKLLFTINKHLFTVGINISKDYFMDKINEWKYVDSAGFSITSNHQYSSDKLLLYNSQNASNELTFNKLSFYIQDKFHINNYYYKLTTNIGFRFTYNTYNKEFLISPRFSALLIPKDSHWYYKFASGYYYQPPLYREMRDFSGKVNYNLLSQRSIHFILGAYNSFKIWARPFKFSSELYFKKLDNLIPYEIDNLRIQYYVNQRSRGYAAGIDLKIYGEFIPGTDSWISLSFMRTREDIFNDFYYIYVDSNGYPTLLPWEIVDTQIVYPGYIPRPSDVLMNLGIFFQDYIPGNENIRMAMAIYFATPSPFGPPQTQRYLATLRSARPYFRTDLSLSFRLKNPNKKYNNFLDKFKSVFLSIDVYNFMGIKNRSGYIWLDIVPVTTILSDKTQFDKIATPQSLTGRILNFNLKIEF